MSTFNFSRSERGGISAEQVAADAIRTSAGQLQIENEDVARREVLRVELEADFGRQVLDLSSLTEPSVVEVSNTGGGYVVVDFGGEEVQGPPEGEALGLSKNASATIRRSPTRFFASGIEPVADVLEINVAPSINGNDKLRGEVRHIRSVDEYWVRGIKEDQDGNTLDEGNKFYALDPDDFSVLGSFTVANTIALRGPVDSDNETPYLVEAPPEGKVLAITDTVGAAGSANIEMFDASDRTGSVVSDPSSLLADENAYACVYESGNFYLHAGPKIYRIDAQTEKVAEVVTSSAVNHNFTLRRGGILYRNGIIYVSGISEESKVSLIDPDSGNLIRKIDFPNVPVQLEGAKDGVFVTINNETVEKISDESFNTDVAFDIDISEDFPSEVYDEAPVLRSPFATSEDTFVATVENGGISSQDAPGFGLFSGGKLRGSSSFTDAEENGGFRERAVDRKRRRVIYFGGDANLDVAASVNFLYINY